MCWQHKPSAAGPWSQCIPQWHGDRSVPACLAPRTWTQRTLGCPNCCCKHPRGALTPQPARYGAYSDPGDTGASGTVLSSKEPLLWLRVRVLALRVGLSPSHQGWHGCAPAACAALVLMGTEPGLCRWERGVKGEPHNGAGKRQDHGRTGACLILCLCQHGHGRGPGARRRASEEQSCPTCSSRLLFPAGAPRTVGLRTLLRRAGRKGRASTAAGMLM